MRFLLARPDHLGDVLLTLPAASALKRSVSGSTVAYLVAASSADAPALSADVDDVLTVDFPPPNDERRPSGEVVERESARLRGRFDAAVILRPRDAWSAAIAAAAAVPVRAGFTTDATEGLLTHGLREPSRTHAARLAEILVREAVAALDVEPMTVDAGPVPTTIPAPAERAVESIVGEHASPVVLHPGAGWSLKMWPLDRWVALARELRREARTLVVGGPAEEALAAEISRASGTRAVTGLRLSSVAALHRRARVVVSTDSGAVHLAAMVGAPVVGIYGPGDPALAAPWCSDDRGRVVRVELRCSPCGVMESPPCGARTRPACVMGVGVAEVLDAARALARGLVRASAQ